MCAHVTGEINMADFQFLLADLEQIRDAQKSLLQY
jgi:hypothetical protein